jgi:hypothetical protein
MDNIVVGGLSINGEEEQWADARAEVIPLGVMVAGRGNRGRLPCLKTETYIGEENMS